jgi:hypothetical protein
VYPEIRNRGSVRKALTTTRARFDVSQIRGAHQPDAQSQSANEGSVGALRASGLWWTNGEPIEDEKVSDLDVKRAESSV